MIEDTTTGNSKHTRNEKDGNGTGRSGQGVGRGIQVEVVEELEEGYLGKTKGDNSACTIGTSSCTLFVRGCFMIFKIDKGTILVDFIHNKNKESPSFTDL